MKKIGIVAATLLAVMFMFAGTSHAVVSAPTTTVTNTWNAPMTNCDGTTLIDLAGTNVYMASSPTGSYTKIGVVSSTTPGAVYSYTDAFTVPNNTAVQRCYMVRAYDASGNESCNDSNQVCKSFFGLDTIGPAGITNLR